jgi:hypothetical protein
MRRFAAGLAALDHKDARASAAKLNRQRETDNAAANDDYIPILHLRIVEDSVTFVTRVVTLLPPIIRSNLLDSDDHAYAQLERENCRGIAVDLWSLA